MSLPLAVAGGLGAAALFGVATVLQHRSARRLDAGGDGHGGDGHGDGHGAHRLDAGYVLAVARRTMTSPLWLAGTAVETVALGLHAFALHQGPLSLVQPLLVTGVLFALLAGSLLGGPSVEPGELVWAAVLIGALATFFVVADPAARRVTDVDVVPAVIAGALAALAVVACAALGARRDGSTAATWFGIGAGIAFAGVAALLKTSTNVLVQGTPLLVSWQLYALCVVGAAGLLLSQLAYRAGPLVASVPAMNSVNPLVSVILGVTVFDERFRAGVVALTLETLSLAVVLVAAIALGRRHPPGAPGDGDGPGAATAP